MNEKEIVVAVVGLGYVGRPLADLFAKAYKTIGYDTDVKKTSGDKGNLLKLTSDRLALQDANTYFICVPTPVDRDNKPDISMLREAVHDVACAMDRHDMVVIESTVAPGTTRAMASYIEGWHGWQEGVDFYMAYSPERVDPGNSGKDMRDVVKVVSSFDEYQGIRLYAMYKSIGLECTTAQSVEVAEAAKLVENIQRDVNIALMNELSESFDRMKINFNDVLDVCRTKWNFADFKPGMVGGHCIPVDPHYLISNPDFPIFTPIMNTARKTNRLQPQKLATRIKCEIYARFDEARRGDLMILIVGAGYKNGIGDLRNSGPVELMRRLQRELPWATLHIVDDLADRETLESETGHRWFDPICDYDVVILCNENISNENWNCIGLADGGFEISLHDGWPHGEGS